MSRATSYNAIKAAVENDERLTRAQGRALLKYADMQSQRAERHFGRVMELIAQLSVERVRHRQDVESWTQLIDRYNSLIHMLDDLLGRTTYDDGRSIAVQYREALVKAFDLAEMLDSRLDVEQHYTGGD